MSNEPIVDNAVSAMNDCQNMGAPMDFLKPIQSLDVAPHEGMSSLAPYPAPYGADGFARPVGHMRRPDRGAGEAGGRFQRRGGVSGGQPRRAVGAGASVVVVDEAAAAGRPRRPAAAALDASSLVPTVRSPGSAPGSTVWKTGT